MTEMQPINDIALKTTRGILWSLAENIGLQAMQFIVSILLARMLLPEQYGLIGMLTLFIGLAQSLLDSGFAAALIQKNDASDLDANSVFYFNLGIGGFLVSLLWITAPIIARFYGQPLLEPLTRFLSINIIINAFGLVPSALLIKRMNFKAMFKISLIAVIVSGGFGVGMAFLGFGVWSLAAQSVLDTLLRMFLQWNASRWKPRWMFSVISLKTMFSFGSRLLLSGLLETFFNNIYQLFIGKVYSAADLGYYVRAQSMQIVAVQPTGSALGRVIFPALVTFQDDKVRLKQAYRKLMMTTVFFHFPLMIGLILVAEPLITLLMTKRWSSSVPYFQLFCLVGLPWPLHILNLNILKVTGRSDVFLRLEVVKKLMVILAIAATFHLGISALLYGQIASSVIGYFLNSYYSGKFINYSTFQQIRDMYPYLLMSIGMGIAMYFVGTAITLDLPKLLAQVLSGVAVYATLDFLLGQSILREALRLFRSVFQVQDAM